MPWPPRRSACPADSPLVSVERLRTVDGTPTALMHNWLPPQFADLTADDLEDASLYAILRARGVAGHRAPDHRRPPPRYPRTAPAQARVR